MIAHRRPAATGPRRRRLGPTPLQAPAHELSALRAGHRGHDPQPAGDLAG